MCRIAKGSVWLGAFGIGRVHQWLVVVGGGDRVRQDGEDTDRPCRVITG